jgi:hypothetical protein
VAGERKDPEDEGPRGFAGLSSLLSDIDVSQTARPREDRTDANGSDAEADDSAGRSNAHSIGMHGRRPTEETQQTSGQESRRSSPERSEQPSKSPIGKWSLGIIVVLGVFSLILANQKSPSSAPAYSQPAQAPSVATSSQPAAPTTNWYDKYNKPTVAVSTPSTPVRSTPQPAQAPTAATPSQPAPSKSNWRDKYKKPASEVSTPSSSIQPKPQPVQISPIATASQPAPSKANWYDKYEEPAHQVSVGFTSLRLASAIDENLLPTRLTTTFSPNDTIYAVVSTSGSAPRAFLKARWTFENSQLVSEDEQSIAPTGDAITSFHIKKPDGWPSGNYKVEISLDGKPVASQDFSVGSKR